MFPGRTRAPPQRGKPVPHLAETPAPFHRHADDFSRGIPFSQKRESGFSNMGTWGDSKGVWRFDQVRREKRRVEFRQSGKPVVTREVATKRPEHVERGDSCRTCTGLCMGEVGIQNSGIQESGKDWLFSCMNWHGVCYTFHCNPAGMHASVRTGSKRRSGRSRNWNGNKNGNGDQYENE